MSHQSTQRKEQTSRHRDVEERSRARAYVPERRPLITALAAAGLVGTVAFAVVAVLLGLVRPGYSFVAQPVVALMSGPNAWVQDVNFVLLGASVIATAIGLQLGVRPSRLGALGAALLVLSGVGPVWAAITDPVPVHFAITFLGAGIGLVVLSRRMTHDPRWHSLAGYALATGIAILVVLPIHSVLALPEGAPLHSLWGLLNWSALALWVTCIAVLAHRLLRVATAADGS
jgi:hypothetical protein